jgi:presenilin-like A22 family membrane protease
MSLALFAAVFIAISLTLLLFHAKLGLRVYGALVYFAILLGVFSYSLSLGSFSAAMTALLMAGLVLFFSPRVLWQNFVLSIALAGIALEFSVSFSAPLIVSLLLFLSVYDIVAVSVTHHMVRMAEQAAAARLPVLYILPYKLRGVFAHVKSYKPGSNAVFLGAGDIALPVMLVAASPQNGLSILIGTCLGFAILVLVFAKMKHPHPMPALPFVTVGALLAHAISSLL